MGTGQSLNPKKPDSTCGKNEFWFATKCWPINNPPSVKQLEDAMYGVCVTGCPLPTLGCEVGDKSSRCYEVMDRINKAVKGYNEDLADCTAPASWVDRVFGCWISKPGNIIPDLLGVVPWWVYAVGGLLVYSIVFK